MSTTVYLQSNYVAVQWLRSLDIFPDNTGVANDLPNPWVGDDLAKSNWDGLNFVTVEVVGSTLLDMYEDSYNPVFQVDVWTRPSNQGSNPKWNNCFNVAEAIRHLPVTMSRYYRLELPTPYPAVVISDVTVESEPRRVTGDPLGLAHVTMDISISFYAEA